MVTINVEGAGGSFPVPVNVFIDNLNNTHDIHFKRDTSFEESFDLDPGCTYSILIGGQNSNEGRVRIRISGDFKTGPDPSNDYESSDPLFSAIFLFTT